MSYRYTLNRTDRDGLLADPDEPRALWIMLNPSTADDTLDDPTIRRVRGFTRRLGYTGFTVVNLYAWRATKPADLWHADDPVGPDNNATLVTEALAALNASAPIIAAWGANAKPARVAEVLALPVIRGANIRCFGTTAAGAPKHPLYLPADAPFTLWERS